MKLTVLIENTAAGNSRLVAEHGLSLLIETRRKKFLFDCGHTGGFPSLIEFAPIDTVYTGENFLGRSD